MYSLISSLKHLIHEETESWVKRLVKATSEYEALALSTGVVLGPKMRAGSVGALSGPPQCVPPGGLDGFPRGQLLSHLCPAALLPTRPLSVTLSNKRLKLIRIKED